MLQRTDMSILGVEICITPDDDYEYIYCKNIHTEAYFFMRRQGDELNLYNVELGHWDKNTFHFSKMKNKDQLLMMIITDVFKMTCPLQSQQEAAAVAEWN